MTEITFRTPSIEDGAEIWKMVDETAALDDNSAYAYFMACRNFAATSVVAEAGDDLAGMVTAYPLPDDPQILFVWQVNVRDKYQGQGLSVRMLKEIMKREDCQSVRWIETTVAPGNEASEAMFRRIAADLNADINVKEVYGDELFPDGEHKVERLFVIGPITRVDNTIQLRKEDGGYRLYAVFADHEEPAFTPANPVFSSLDDALQAAEDVREHHAVSEIVIVERQDLV